MVVVSLRETVPLAEREVYFAALPRYFENLPGEREPPRILCLGALDWRPNLDAVGLFLDRIFPKTSFPESSWHPR